MKLGKSKTIVNGFERKLLGAVLDSAKLRVLRALVPYMPYSLRALVFLHTLQVIK